MAFLVKAPTFKNNRTTLERLEKFVSHEYFTDCNLRGRLYGDRSPLKKLAHVDCGQHRLPFTEAAQKLERQGQETSVGLTIGPSWSTHWFRAEIVIPDEWRRNKTIVRFRWDTGGEAMVWSKDGQPLRGLSSEYHKTDYPIACSDTGTSAADPLVLYVEVACNTSFGCGAGGAINPPDPERTFTLKTAEIAVFRQDVFTLLMDFAVLNGMAKHLPENGQTRYEVMYYANDLVNKCDVTSPESIAECHEKAKEFLEQCLLSRSAEISGGLLGDDRFVIHAIGNSHIDTAWLWPYDETKRKCARTFSTVLDLMEKYPDSIRFAVSQAQQLDWVRVNYPSLFDRIRAKASEQKFLPVGGCWVEMDGNIPSGESLVRQMLYGQRFFDEHFGRRCTEFWLPDTFGYPSQLPQLMTLAGMKRFVTQKMSWNLVNRFPHHTFWWKGLDGTKVLTHFPPADTYCSTVTVEEAVKINKDFNDKGRTHSAMLLYGYGDGGGGPDEEMLERLQRMKSLPGLPQVHPSTPADFFASVERNDLELDNLATWSGELYLELHNGTYTTHCDVKRLNRKCEFLLRDCEFVTAILWTANKGAGGSGGMIKSWENEWKNVLLNQFHDVLPGTSIAAVYEDAVRLYDQTRESCEQFLRGNDGSGESTDDTKTTYLINSLPWPRVTVSDDGRWHKLPPMSVTKPESALFHPDPTTNQSTAPVQIIEQSSAFIFRNAFLQAAIAKRTGQVISLVPLMKPGAAAEPADFLYDAVRPGLSVNRFVLYDDVPLYWDAWDVMDYHLETGKLCETLVGPVTLVSSSPTCCAVEYTLAIGNNGGSLLKQRIALRANQPYLEFQTTVHWVERHKILKVTFPFNIHAQDATYEIQFGHLKRPAHRNTSWESAKFEVCGHKWADVSECDFGVALLNDSKYGHSCYDGELSMSVIRGPTAPDPTADFNCDHEFTYALMPHLGPLHQRNNPDVLGSLNVIQAAYELNTPPLMVKLDSKAAENVVASGGERGSWLSVDNPAVMIEAVKVSEDGQAVIVRLYECYGGKGRAKLTVGFQIRDAKMCNLLEEPVEADDDDSLLGVTDGGKVSFTLRPFQVLTLRLSIH